MSGEEKVQVLIQRLDPDLPLPAYEHPGDAGMDLRSTIDVVIGPGERADVPTGIAIALPPGYVGLVHPRSGLARRHGLTVTNAPGTIDAGYRGEIVVNLTNLDRSAAVSLVRGDRVAQLLVQRVAWAQLYEVGELPGSHRGASGFGSTGVA